MAKVWILALALIWFGRAQVPREFDAVSIKPYAPKGPPYEACNPRTDPVMLVRTGCPLLQLVVQAYAIKLYQVRVNAPDWVSTDPFVVAARTAEPATRAEMMTMLQSALASRFQLQVHWETRDAPAYAIEVANRGPKLAAATKKDQCGSVLYNPGIIKSDCFSLDDLAELFQESVFGDRPVVNKTGLDQTRQFEIKLEYAAGDNNPDGPTIFTALTEQLGLTLKASKTPVKTLVIDHAQRPQPN